MSGAMRRIGEYLGLVEDTGRYDEYDDYDSADARTAETAPVAARPRAEAAVGAPREFREPQRPAATATVADLAERRRSAPVAAAPEPASSAELSRITTLHPRTYNEARVVGENFRDGFPVIMNLTEMADDDAKRLVDFAAGLVFATHGSIERITAKVFLLSPPNVTVAAEEKQRIADAGFFNQS